MNDIHGCEGDGNWLGLGEEDQWIEGGEMRSIIPECATADQWLSNIDGLMIKIMNMELNAL